MNFSNHSLLLAVLLQIGVLASGKHLKGSKYVVSPYANSECDADNFAGELEEDPNNPHGYLQCSPDGVFLPMNCPTLSEDGGETKVKRVFFKDIKSCLHPGFMKQNAAGSSKFGEVCRFNTDCLTGMWCSSGTCQCLSNFIERDDYCYAKVNPSQSGCTYSEQCTAVWPSSTCDTTSSTCNCPSYTIAGVLTPWVARKTRDGYVCIQPGNNLCALPAADGTSLGVGGLSTLFASTTAPPFPPTAPTATPTPQTCTVGSATPGCRADTATDIDNNYDCVLDPSSAATTGICCPNKASVCIMPMMGRVTGGSQSRWWYNSVTGTCDQFLWNPATQIPAAGTALPGNANNFLTLEQCQSYCQDTCSRGNPQYSTTATAQQDTSPVTCSSATACDSNNECTTIGSLQYCCPTATYICSQNGGLPIRTGNTNLYDEGFSIGTRTDQISRWYYDTTVSKCQQFTYKGIAGNMNNFLTEADCKNYCEKLLCDKGSPITDSSGDNLACTSNSGCPSAYQCTNSVCCPRKQTVCAQTKQQGTCGRFVVRYWFNAITGECESFTYSGCQGNDNNFETLIGCQNYCRNTRPEPKCIQGTAYKDTNGNFYVCSNSGIGNVCPQNYDCYYDGFVWGCCPSQTYTCSLTSNTGAVCGPQTVRWFYDTTTKSCQTFAYNGCNGNSNNFANRALCEAYCGVGGCPNGGEPYRETSDNTIRTCSASKTCPSNYDCTQVYTGGNQANYCCPTKSRICGTPPNQVQSCSGTTALVRFYYNLATRSCTQFQYFPCDQTSSLNYNNFATLAQCSDFCASSACPPGEAVYADPNTNMPLTCNPSVTNNCPSDYTCRYDQLTGNNVCCGASNMNVCPSSEKAYIDPRTLQARECTPNVEGTCYLNYLCRFNPSVAKYYCCLPKDFCPAGKAVFRDGTLSNRPQTCTLSSVVNACPSGYSCQAAFNQTTSTSYTGFCCSVDPICANGGRFEEDQTTQKPKACIVRNVGVLGSSGCGAGYNCVPTSATSSNGFCCAGTLDVCGNNANQQALLSNGRPQTCNGNSLSNSGCPSGYDCQLYTATNAYFCCTQASDGCPAGYRTKISAENNPTICYQNVPSSCPANHLCVNVPAFNRSQCCEPIRNGTAVQSTSADGCPVGMRGYNSGFGVQQCTVGSTSTCPTGYTCQYSGARGYQCCGLPNGCPNGAMAEVNSQTGTVRRCGSPNSANQCSFGYSCQSSTTGGFTCCTGQSIQNTQVISNVQCPSGGSVYSNSGNGQPLGCILNQNTCPSGYSCQSTSSGNYCCSGGQSNGVRFRDCVAGSEALYPSTNSPLDCGPARNNCPSGTQCSYSQTYANYICCRSFRRRKEAAPSDNKVEKFVEGSVIENGLDLEEESMSGREGQGGGKRPMFPEEMGMLPEFMNNNQRQQQHQQTVYNQTKQQQQTVNYNQYGNGFCDINKAVGLGDECCAPEQCRDVGNRCVEYKGQSRCLCPPNQFLDLSNSYRDCVNSCEYRYNVVRDGPYCVTKSRPQPSLHSTFPQPFRDDNNNDGDDREE